MTQQTAAEQLLAVIAEMTEHIRSGDDYADPAKLADWQQRAQAAIQLVWYTAAEEKED